MRIEGAIFDLDGTLTDSMYIWNEAPKALAEGPMRAVILLALMSMEMSFSAWFSP